MIDTPETPMDDDALAAEYVLRLMSADAEKEFEKRLASDATLRAHVTAWEVDLAYLADAVEEVVPPSSVKAKLMDRISPKQTHSSRGFLTWRWPLGLATAALIAFFAIGPLVRAPEFNPTYHASLASSDGVLRIEAGFAPDSNLFKVLRPVGDPRPDRVLELWVIAEGADAPVSLGVLPDERELLYVLDAELVPLMRGGTLAVSDEPLGGSPTGAPTGDVLAAAPLLDI